MIINHPCPKSSVSPATTSLTIVILSRKDKEHLLQDISRVRQNTYTRSRPLYSLSLSEYFHHRCHIYQPYKHYHFHACFLQFHMQTTCIHPRAIETDQKTVYDIRGATCISDAVIILNIRKVNLLDKRSRMVRNHAFVMMKVIIFLILGVGGRGIMFSVIMMTIHNIYM